MRSAMWAFWVCLAMIGGGVTASGCTVEVTDAGSSSGDKSSDTDGKSGDDGKGGGTNGGGDGDGDGDEVECDVSTCKAYCDNVTVCRFDGDLDGSDCEKDCEENCGNGFFDATDQEQIDCMIDAGISFGCDDFQTCCGENFTSELCP